MFYSFWSTGLLNSWLSLRYFILSDEILNFFFFFFLLSLSHSSLLVCRKVTDIYILILYPAALLKSFNSSNSLLMESLGFSIYSTVSPALVAQMVKNLPAM